MKFIDVNTKLINFLLLTMGPSYDNGYKLDQSIYSVHSSSFFTGTSRTSS
jgi:hypothetical protein